jgi:hypothetical protein
MEINAIDESLPVACEVAAVPEDERVRWLEVGRQFYSTVEEVLELPDGYALKLGPHALDVVGEYLSRDRLCCRFVRWELIVEQANGPIWLKMRGPRGTKAFMVEALERSDILRVEVARRAGLAVDRRAPVALDDIAALANDLPRSSASRKVE